MAVGYAIVAIVAAAVAVFALQNSEPASVRFIAWSLQAVPVAALVLVSLAAGLVVAGVPLALARWRLRGRCRALEARLAELERSAAERERPMAPRPPAPVPPPPPTTTEPRRAAGP